MACGQFHRAFQYDRQRITWKTTPERYMTPPDIFDLVLILRALMHHLSGIFGFWIGWGMTKNHLRIVSRERSLKCMLCSKCNGRLLLTFSGQKGSRFSGPTGIARARERPWSGYSLGPRLKKLHEESGIWTLLAFMPCWLRQLLCSPLVPSRARCYVILPLCNSTIIFKRECVGI